MSEFEVKVGNVRAIAREQDTINKQMKQLEEAIQQVQNGLSFEIAQKERIRQRLRTVGNAISSQAKGLSNASKALEQIADTYETTERKLAGLKISAKESIWDKFVKEFQSEFGWSDLLKGSNYIGTIYGLINDIKNGKTWKDLGNSGYKIYEFMENAAKTYSNYKKIGNAVGKKKAMTWWAKNITGLKSLGRASAAKNPVTRFVNNLTNKTSPFNIRKNFVDNFSGANGAKKAVASWATVAVSAVTNWFSNKEEQANSNGTMSDGRVLAETVMETIVDTVLTNTTSIVVGAAVTTAFGTVAAPGVLVVAVSGVIVAGFNAGVKALTGKTTTEWISDSILDLVGNIGRAVVSNPIGKWFQKLSFA